MVRGRWRAFSNHYRLVLRRGKQLDASCYEGECRPIISPPDAVFYVRSALQTHRPIEHQENHPPLLNKAPDVATITTVRIWQFTARVRPEWRLLRLALKPGARKKIESGNGLGNFRNMFISIPCAGNPTGLKLIWLYYSAKDEFQK
ncbi:hypothetical protein BHJ80_14590 [Escherichia coli]|nr:hypothetical protein BHJ80_14590 [Escherichia coli]